MKRIFSIVLVVAAALSAAPSASAYSEEMAELATMLDQGMSADGTSVSYDGKSIVITFPASCFSEDEKEMFSDMESLQPLASQFKKHLGEAMGAESMAMLGTIFSQFDTDLVVRIDLEGNTKDIVITGAQLLDSGF